jgi:hypothetical protein
MGTRPFRSPRGNQLAGVDQRLIPPDFVLPHPPTAGQIPTPGIPASNHQGVVTGTGAAASEGNVIANTAKAWTADNMLSS